MKLRTAVVGVGYLGQFHAQKHKALTTGAWSTQAEFVGVCDLNATQAEKIAQDLGVKAFTRPQDLIGKVDAVTVASITPAHYELTKMFLEAGIHVNVEKPITVNVSEAQELIALAKKKNVILTVGHSERFSPVFTRLRELVINPLYVELFRHAPFKPRGAEVSVLHDLAIHDVDLALNLCAPQLSDTRDVTVTHAAGSRLATQQLDWSQFSLAFAGVKAKALISVSRVSADVQRLIRVYEPDRNIVANFATGEIVISRGAEISAPEAVGKGDNLLMETEAFLSAIIKKTPVVVSGEDGCRALDLLDQVAKKIT